MTGGSRRGGRGRRFAPDPVQQHRDWLALVEVTGPFLSLPVLRATWPSLEAIEPDEREELRRAHGRWRLGGEQRAWVEYVLRELLGWAGELRWADGDGDGLEPLAVAVPEHDTTVEPSFALVEPGTGDGAVKPDGVRLLGMVCEPGAAPTARVRDSAWAATPVDRLAQLCRYHGVELGLVTDGRWWALVWAPRGGVTSTAVFDAVAWPEAAERDVVRAFRSLLGRRRFFGVPEAERLVPLLRASLDSQEDITEALGVQVRQAVELLVAAIGRADVRERQAGGPGLEQVSAHEVYRGAVSVMMRVVFLLFAEERGLLPADNELYAAAYSAGRLCAELEQRALEGSEEELENSHAAWHRLLALFTAVYRGIDHPRLRMHPHNGSLFDPDTYPWLSPTSVTLSIDDRTVLHMLRAVQYVEVGSGRNRERRTLSFRQLDVEQIGYVYEGLLSFEGFRADDVVVGLVGKPGLEEEVALTDLERLGAGEGSTDMLAAALAATYKPSGIGTVRALERRLAPLGPTEREDARKKLLAVTDGDYPLAERLLPFFGVLRRDLRDLPVVILPGALYVTESALRRNTGTHYTPRFLAEQVVEGALEPLIYRVGPLQTADRSRWVPRSSAEILELKIADIAMGSAAFLVAAARYLAGALIDAWVREGAVSGGPAPGTSWSHNVDGERVSGTSWSHNVDGERVSGTSWSHDADGPGAGVGAGSRALDADEDPLVVEARRQIIEHCLYGVDINPMAVEMAKLSLWLVSMDPQRPFTFLDDRLVAGDSLLGITSLEQLEYLHMDPAKGREIHRDLFDWTAGVRQQAAAIAGLRREIGAVELGDDPIAALEHKRALLEDAQLQAGRLRLFADLAVGAALAHAGRGERGLAAGSVAAARLAGDVAAGKGELAAREQRRDWLRTDQPDGGFDRDPLHWPLVFPEVFERGGFDAIIGNPPFLGGKKISGATGSAYREYLVDVIGRAARGHADLIAYFVLRAHDLLDNSGQTGLIATNTLAQGDTREVGLDQLVAGGVSIRQAVKSEPWPSKSAVLEYCAVWTSRAPLGEAAERRADGLVVPGITPSLDAEARVAGNPHRLVANAGLSFIGSYVLGLGFTMKPEQAQELIAEDPRNAEVLFPYLNGQDLNSDRECMASRWVINFHDWTEDQARGYRRVFAVIESEVKPERQRCKPNGSYALRTPLPQRYWHYADKRPAMVEAIAGLKRVVVITLVSKTVMPALVPTGQVFAHKLGVFATDDTAMLALLSSAPHYWWTRSRTSTMKTDINYSPSDVFETFPLPTLTPELRELGDTLDTFRRNVMASRRSGLTKTYNLVFDPGVTDADIVELRAVHEAIDRATVAAYGWDDLLDRLDHGFHPAGRDTRYTIGPAAQREILDRLLELNHERYAEEVTAGRHAKKGRKPKAAKNDGTLF
ncbi:Eco57I restriction-modification methylase domain-containing protein [Pseudonocardia asaccharolytica]|uniref:site-specific DNA-methyltransferase (adenine-specific) n=1 Tax=Pseudonocardia asaccharolytica DSM 44247 = NBRC 16224 TaxID=1123024 RepID=A0A511D460_9PSEU|nr:DNA methyltransferase [Pseudonocardia asaccharolytica]GEL18374.1 hypothetical protein PA7_22110 [Pseudonocardia asaccharolytica DSM 44247 = NBRC 16224]